MRKTAELDWSQTLPTAGKVTMYQPSTVGGLRIPGGPLQGFLTSTAIGAGLGAGVGGLVNMFSDDDEKRKKKRSRKWMLLGALGTGIPSGVASYGIAKKTVPRFGWLKGLTDTSVDKQASQAWMPMEVTSAVNTIASDNNMTPFAKALSINMVLEANQGQGQGQFTFGQLAQAGAGAGLGLLGGTVMARVLSDMIGLPRAGTRKFMGRGGILGGALIGGGFVR